MNNEQIIQEEVSLFFGRDESEDSGYVLVDVGTDFFVFENDQPITVLPRFAVWTKGDNPIIVDRGNDEGELRRTYNINPKEDDVWNG
jgi:hypothetical protein